MSTYNERLLERAKEAITTLFSDQKVSKHKALANLIEVKDLVDTYVGVLENEAAEELLDDDDDDE